MKKKISKFYYLIPVIYIGLITLFIFLQINKDKYFSNTFHGISITGEKISGFKSNNKIKKLSLQFRNIRLSFSDKDKIKIREGNLVNRISIKGYKLNKNTLTILLDNDGEIKVEYNSNSNSFSISQNFITDNKTLLLPFTLEKNNYTFSNNFPFLYYNLDNSYLAVLLPPGSEFDLENETLGWNINNENYSNKIMILTINNDFPPQIIWYSNMISKETEESFDNKLNEYVDRAFEQWTSERFLKSTGKWKMPDGSVNFDEKIIASIVSESLNDKNKRKYIPLFLNVLRSQLKKNTSSKLPLLTSPYFGGMKKFLLTMQNRDSVKLNRIVDSIRKRENKVFLEKNLVATILDRGPFSLLEEIIKYADSLYLKNLDIEYSVMLFKFYTDLIQYTGYNEHYHSRVMELLENNILPSIYPLNDKIFIVDEVDKKRNIRLKFTLISGFCLLKITEPKANDKRYMNLLNSMGKKLIVSAISTSGSIPPEEIYPYIADYKKTYYPREIPLYRYSEPGQWLWTAAKIENLKFSKNQYTLSVSYPLKETHFILFQGIGPMKTIQIHGIEWKQDPQYYRYSDGWYYERKTKSLFLKLTQKKKIEVITINF